MLQRIEKGNIKCEIGAVFEVASILGVNLFDEATLNEVDRKLLWERQFLNPFSVEQ